MGCGASKNASNVVETTSPALEREPKLPNVNLSNSIKLDPLPKIKHASLSKINNGKKYITLKANLFVIK